MTIKTLPLVAMMATIGLSTFGLTAKADDAPAGVTLRNFSYAGSGCPAGTVSGNLPVDGNDFFISWGSFDAQVGPGIPTRDKRRNCQMLLELAVPAGWQYTVESIQYNGAVDIESDVEAIAGSAYYFQGDSRTVRFNTLFEGPETRAFRVTDTVDAATQVWSPCGGGRALNLNYQVRVNAIAEAGAGTITFGNPNGDADTHIALEWRACSAE